MSGDAPSDEEPRGPWAMARELEALIPETVRARDAAKTTAERKQHQLRLKSQRMLLSWCKTRAGYVDPMRMNR